MGFGKDGLGVIIRESRNTTLGTLANSTGLFIGTKLATLERFRMLKTEVFASVTALSSGDGTGLYFGLADGDLTLAEVEAAIEANGPLGPNDPIAEEISERPVWIFGALSHELSTEAIFHNMEGGDIMVGKPRWTFARTKSWNWFVYNMGAAPTTGATIRMRSKSFGVWVV